MGDDLYLNGEYMPLSMGRVSVLDRGFQFAEGAYEVVRFRGERFLWLEEHLARLERSLAKLDFPCGEEDGRIGARMTGVLAELVRRSGYDLGSAYLQVTSGEAPRDFRSPPCNTPTELAYVQPQTFLTWEQVQEGTTAILHEDIRWARCDIKSTALTAAVMGKAAAAARGAAEVIWVGADGKVREGGSCNVFVVRKGEVWTHPADHRVLAGVTRRHVIELARGLGIPVHEQPVAAEELLSADEVLLTSTMRDVLPIWRVDGQTIATGKAGEVTLSLAAALRAAVDQELGAR